jgi:predicted dehydrogenase
MRFAIVGCGYVAEFYAKTLPNHPNLELAGVFDKDAERSRRSAERYGVRCYRSLEEVLSDPTVQLVANLTNPRSHYGITKAALEAGKHVYSEKPLGMCLREAEELVELAEERRRLLSGAPCNVLSESAQTLWKALREGCIGTPRRAYAELDDEVVFLNYRKWANEAGTPWPHQDEFETGCALEHAGYYLGWLTTFFGPAKRIVSFSDVLFPDKGDLTGCRTPDFAVGCIEFVSGVVARITCSIHTNQDHSLRVFGDDGVLTVPDCWDYGAPVYLIPRVPKSWRERNSRRARVLRMGRPSVPLLRRSNFICYTDDAHRMDFCRGMAELADAASENRQPRLSARWLLHLTELALAISDGEGQRELRTTFEPIPPMPWAD